MKTGGKGILSAAFFVILIGFSGCGKIKTTSPDVNKKTILFTPSGIPSDNSVYLEQVSINNDEITLMLKIKGGADVFSAAPEIDFDGNKIQFVAGSGSEGAFLSQGGTTTTFKAEMEENSKDILLIGISRQSGASGANGDGVLCRFVLKALVTQENTAVDLHLTHSALRASSGEIIPGTSWLGGKLSYK